MKKFYISLCAAACLFAFSCTKAETPADDSQNNTEENPEVVEPTVPEEVPEGYVRIKVMANVESDEAPQQESENQSNKTAISNGEGGERVIMWNAGDKIKVLYEGGSTETKALADGKSTNLVFDLPKEVTSYTLCYPADADYTLTESGLSLVIPEEQGGTFANTHFSVATADVEETTVQFFNATAMFKVVVTDETLTKAVISANNGESLVGTLPCTLTADAITPGEAIETSSSLTLNINGAGTYYVSVLPGLSLTEGATVRFYRDQAKAGAYKLTSKLNVPRSKIASWGELDKRACNRFVTVDGAGERTGDSWVNAWGRAELKAFLNNSAAYDEAALDLMNGITIRLAAGTYVIPDSDGDETQMKYLKDGMQGDEEDCCISDLNFSFVGGYPANGGDEADPATNETILSGNEQGPVLLVYNQIALSFSGITFSNGKTNAGGKGVLTFNALGSIDIDNCKFINNKNTYTCGSLNISAGAQFTVNSCTFQGNSAGNAGAFNVDGGTTIGTVSGCDFVGNATLSVAGNGGAVKISNGEVVFTGCTFTGNTTLFEGETGSHGGAVWLDGGKANFTSCTFKGNSSRWGGAIYSKNNGNGIFTGCVFGGTADGEGNSANPGSGGVVAIDAGTVTFNQCTVTGNKSATDRGGACFVTGSSSLTVDGGVFSSNSAVRGGCIFVQSSASSTVSNAEFKNNTATTEGGVFLATKTSTLSVTSCDIHENSSPSGGVFVLEDEATININENQIYENHADKAGGVIIVNGYNAKGTELNPTSPTLNINDGNVFTSNYCTSGGGVIRVRQEPTVDTAEDVDGNESKADINVTGNNVFKSNYASGGYGGCFDLRTSGTVNISGATFEGNYTNKDASYTKGGALNLTDSGMNTAEFNISNCKFIDNHTYESTSQACNGGAINVGGNGTELAMITKIDQCFFDGNYAKQGGAIYTHNNSSKTYLNACVFTGNYISYRYGTTIASAAGDLFMNNCVIADDTYSTSGSNQQCTWLNFKGDNLIVSNSTLIGTTRKNSSASAASSSSACLVRYDDRTTTHYLINNIIASTQSGCAAVWADNAPVINMVSNKLSSINIGSDVTINQTGTNSVGFMGNSSYFGALEWVSGNAVSNTYWGWNGALTGGENTNMANLADVKAAIQTADADFYTWLNSLGALDKDARGEARAATTWPGAYEN